MLIGDAGYGLLFLLLPLVFYRKLVKVAGKEKVNLILVIGAVTLAWGVLTANYFGLTPDDMAKAANCDSVSAMAGGTGLAANVGNAMVAAGVLWDANPEKARAIIIKVSFLLGMIHLVLGHLRQAVGFFPSSKALSEIGWALVLVGMLGVIWLLFKQGMPKYFVVTGGMMTATYWLLGVGYALAVLFAFPGEKPAKRVMFGFANSLLPMLGTFGDTMSYIRLMAVGLASYYIASAFNGLGAMVAQGNPVMWVVGVPVIVFGHALNIGLAAIAIFAHGVRLNMLEFSNSAGVQWAGYPYQPFAQEQGKES
jgi:V/A-type H+-transporting ATPase subunit I